ncbi:SusC/RagA family TonB-linked outer membrane protein [uncultured Alistipes sp.]|jgi:tonB-linked outer membrane protein, susC/ragA family|uniref:SusC/RagA family TonB-linked outer membrane protein n=1 Tax=uncultured Alistipes sp. TaxID=538949 RepID=UPI0025CC1C33|nr:SusC/RagA family TonB-linked outer membrane protein [uncultured Alistipes sp.]
MKNRFAEAGGSVTGYFLRLVCCLALLASATLAQAQTRNQISGKVTDTAGEPLIGATIVVVGTVTGATTGVDGTFTINAPADGQLKVSYIGYAEQTIPVGSRTTIDIVMEDDSQMLKDVVVVGYGTMEKKSITSSISSVKGDDLTAGMGGSTIATALQGKIPGLTISGSSSPNSGNNFQLRGVASVNAGKGPLVVIDGVPGGDIRALNQEDIESIDVLKDASAGAIYGTRAAGGVILITTKQARRGRITAKYSGEFSVETVRKTPDLLSSSEYIEYGRGDDYGYDTDWYRELVHSAPFSHRHTVSVSGGSDVAQVYTSFMAQDQKGMVLGDNRKDYSGRVNAKFNLFDGKVEVRANAMFREAERDNRNSSGIFKQAFLLNPTIPLYSPDAPSKYNVSGYGIAGTSFNPVADIELRTNNGKDQWLLADATIKINLIKGLSVQGTIGIDKRQYQQYTYVSHDHKESLDNFRRGGASHKFSKSNLVSMETYASYNTTIREDHRIDIVAGYSFLQKGGESFNMTNYNFPVDGIGPWDIGVEGSWLQDGKASMGSNKTPRERLLSMFGRANYAYKDRYMATVSFRREGSSKFGPNNRWGNFWAVSGGWRISNEAFLRDVSWISDLKVRMGYGVTGNNDFGNYNTVRMYSANDVWPTNGVWQPGYGSKENVNPDLKWEEKSEFNFGVDFALFDNRLWGKFDVYKRQVDDMLYKANAPMPPMVHKTIMKNIGSLENSGWEFEIGGDIVRKKNFTYTSSLRFSHNKSKMKNMGDAGYFVESDAFPSPGNPGTPGRLQNGTVIGQYFLFKHAGLDEDGKWLIYDKNNEIVPAYGNTTIDNRHYVGNAIPKVILSWDHSFRYKNWDLSVFLRSWLKFDVFNQMDMYYGLAAAPTQNVLKSAYTRNKNIKDEKILSDYWLDDGSFLKIDAINLGYTLNLRKWTRYIESAKIYLTIRDLAVFTNYTGMNPEVDINGLYPGYEYINNTSSMYPQTTRFTVGVQLTF